jgi:hypothetical protein
VLYPLSYGGVTRSEHTEAVRYARTSTTSARLQRSSAITFANGSACGACTMM